MCESKRWQGQGDGNSLNWRIVEVISTEKSLFEWEILCVQIAFMVLNKGKDTVCSLLT